MGSEESPWIDDPHVLKPNVTSKTTLEYMSMVTDYISIPLSTITIAADILLIVIILKYKRLKTRTNYYLINFAVFHMLYIISTPLFYIVLDIFYNGHMEIRWYCVWIRVENVAMGLTLTFIAGFGVDSFIENVRPSWFSKYKERYPYVFSFFYFGHFLIFLLTGSICLKHAFTNNFSFYFLSTYYFIILIVILYISYVEQRMERNLKLSTPHKTYALNISFIVLLIWMPLIIFYDLMVIFKKVEKIEKVLWHIAFLPEYFAYCCSIVIVYKLWKTNKYFKVALRKVFRRTVSDSEYDNLNVNDNEEGVRKPL